LSPTLSGRDDQGNWYAKARAVFTPEWEEQERTRLEPQRTELQTQWKEALEKARRQMEQIQRDSLAKAGAAELPAHEALDEGVAFYNNKQYERAVTSFRNAVWHWNAVRLNPPSEVYEYMGNAYHKLENYPEARAAYRKALELDPGNINARALLEEVSPARERE
ncbi:MAG: tetratricopeptide repeat protein, partial [Treponema sp.]|nr:tetratricopeptide repeat protein [Treponema sp.]